MSRNRITGGDGFWIFIIGIFLLASYPKILFLVLVFGLVLAVLFFLYSHEKKPFCNNCNTQVSPMHLHRKIDGRPDLRYKHNPLICVNCGGNSFHYADRNSTTADLNFMHNIPDKNNAFELEKELEIKRSENLKIRALDARHRMNVLRKKWGLPAPSQKDETTTNIVQPANLTAQYNNENRVSPTESEKELEVKHSEKLSTRAVEARRRMDILRKKWGLPVTSRNDEITTDIIKPANLTTSNDKTV